MAASSYPLPSFITLYSISEADGTVIAGQEQSGQRSLIKLLAATSLWPTLPHPCVNSPAKLHSLRSQSGPSSGSSPPLPMALWACTRVYGPEFKFPVGKLEAYHKLGHCASSLCQWLSPHGSVQGRGPPGTSAMLWNSQKQPHLGSLPSFTETATGTWSCIGFGH